jgi:hypothetical protein
MSDFDFPLAAVFFVAVDVDSALDFVFFSFCSPSAFFGLAVVTRLEEEGPALARLARFVGKVGEAGDDGRFVRSSTAFEERLKARVQRL